LSEKEYVGGQAVIEGIMMRSPRRVAVAVRLPDGEIDVSSWSSVPLHARNKFFKMPFIRGMFVLIDSLVWGVKALNYSANKSLEKEEEKLSTKEIVLSVLLAIGMAVGLFIVLPKLAVSFLAHGNSTFVSNVIEGGIRVSFFLLYIWVIGLVPDIRRVFEYHGAEHKTIMAYEAGADLNPQDVINYTRFHPRCGTAFILVVLVISIFAFSLVDISHELWIRILGRVVVLPVISGVSYEIIRLASKNSTVATIFIKPGLWLQYLTTRNPSEDQLEVAIASLKAALGDGEENVGGTKVDREAI